MKKVIVAQLSIKEEYVEAFLPLADIMVNNTNNEPGCICYKLLRAVDDSGEFFFYEEYVDAAAIDYHNGSAHFKAFGEAIASMLSKDPVVEVF